jgi:hypothetical protein
MCYDFRLGVLLCGGDTAQGNNLLCCAVGTPRKTTISLFGVLTKQIGEKQIFMAKKSL